MMHTPYCTSILSLRSHTCINDYYYSYCSCCFSLPINSCVPTITNPTFLYGLRQSSLIQCPPSRRFLSGSNHLYRSSFDVGSSCCFGSSCVMLRQESIDSVRRNCCNKERSNVGVNSVKGSNLRVYALGGDAEAMLSLLNEDIVEECVVFREKTKRVPKGGRVVSKKKVVIEDWNDDVGSGYRESKPKVRRVKSERGPSRDEGRRPQRLRMKESGSSCYSGEFGSDIELDVEQDQELERKQFFGEASTSQKKDSSKSGGVVITEEVKHDWEKYRDDRNQELPSSRRDDHRVGSSIHQNWRNKSEKKLTEESNSRDESAAFRQSTLSQAKESSAMIASTSKQQSSFQKEKSSSDVKLQGQSSARIQKDNRAGDCLKSSIKNESLTQQRRDNIETTSTSGRSSRRKEDLEIVDMSVVESGCEFCKTCGRSMEERKTHSDFKQQSKMIVDARLNINAKSMSENRQRRQEKGSSSLQSTVVDESKQHSQMHMVTGQASAKQKSQHHLEISSSSDTSIREQQAETLMQSIAEHSRISVNSQSESRRRKEETSTSSTQISAKEEKRLHDQLYLETGQLDARRKSQQSSETMVDDASFSRSNLRSQWQSETRKKHSEEKTSLSSAEESSKVSHTDIGHSRVHSSDLEINTQSISDKTVYNEQIYSKAKVQSLEEVVEKRKRIEETVVQSTLRTEVQGPSTGYSSGEATISQPLTSSITQIGVQELSGQETKSRMGNEMGRIVEVRSGSTQIHPQAVSLSSFSSEVDDKSEQLSVTYPTYQYESQLHESAGSGMRNDMGRIVEIGSGSTQIDPQAVSLSSFSSKVEDKSEKLSVTAPTYKYESQFLEESSSGMRNDMGRIIEVGSGSTQMHLEARIPLSYSEDDDDKRKFNEEDKDALESAARMQESSALIIAEFVEQMGHKASTSETSSEKRFSKQDFKYPDEKQLPKISPQSRIDNAGLHNQGSASSRVSTPESDRKESQIQESKHSSTDSLTKGSSDEMWDVKDHFAQEASEMESSEGAKSETTVSGRTGKFLWGIVAGIGRFGWGSRSEKQKSPVKKQISPTGSASGETWFNGDEVDETNGNGNGNNKGVEAEKTKLLQQSISDHSLLRTTTSRKEGVVIGVGDKLGLVDVGASSSSSASSGLQGSSISGGAFVGQSTDLNIPQLMSLPSPSVGLSIPSAMELRRSLAFEELDEEEKKETPVSSSEEQKDYFQEERQSDVSPSEGTDVSPSEGGMEIDSKRRLQRSKVVLQRYDEWEDAYRRECEQKKVDEIFMREALSEAMQAADSWEVPVGAVLVQNGIIIARGYNLVEELRDSTAHAEMICIREASNALRTWRLSGTTLYVTLEPCPMCAGAILQARISTLVWGAPNKLLGADGSWIRLFPEGMEGDERSEAINKPAAPVHPFHPKMNIRRGILQEECADIMQQFFQLKRRKAKAKPKVEPSEEPDQPTCFPRPKHKSKLLHKMHNLFHPSNPSVD